MKKLLLPHKHGTVTSIMLIFSALIFMGAPCNPTTPPTPLPDGYYIQAKAFATPNNFNSNLCQPFGFTPVSQTVPWSDLWLNDWTIEVYVYTPSNAWKNDMTGCKQRNAFWSMNINNGVATNSNYFFTIDDPDELKIVAPSNTPFFVYCKVTTKCTNCNTSFPGVVLSYSWSTIPVLMNPSDFSVGSTLYIGQLVNETLNYPTLNCPCP